MLRYLLRRIGYGFLILLGVSEETAAADACKMEHDLSEETYTRIKEHAAKHGVALDELND